MIKFTAPISPVPFMRAIPALHVVNPKRYRQFKADLGWFAKQAMHGREPFKGAIKLHADFYKLSPKNPLSQRWGDGDNFLKAVMDALQGICYLNDAQVKKAAFEKFYGEPHIEIELEEL